MYDIIGQHDSQETGIRSYAKPETRNQLAKQILSCAKLEQQAVDLLKQLLSQLS